MTHRQKVERVIRELKARGVSPYTTAPPLFRVLWAAGFEIPPPLFLDFGPLLLLMGVSFATISGALIWLALMWLAERRMPTLPVEWLVLGFVSVGLLFGLTVACYCRWKARRLGLPRWNEYGEA